MKKGLLALALSGLGLFSMASSSRAATLAIQLQEDGGAITTVATQATGPGGAIQFTGTYGDFSVVLNGASSSQGVALSGLQGSTTSISNTNGITHTLKVFITQTDYTLPAGSPLTVTSGLGGSISSGSLGLTGIFQGYADSGNAAFGIADFTTGPQNANLNGSTFDTGSAGGQFNRGGSFSLTSVATIVLSAGGSVNFSDHVNVAAPLPSAAWGGLGLLGMIAGSHFVRRRQLA